MSIHVEFVVQNLMAKDLTLVHMHVHIMWVYLACYISTVYMHTICVSQSMQCTYRTHALLGACAYTSTGRECVLISELRLITCEYGTCKCNLS